MLVRMLSENDGPVTSSVTQSADDIDALENPGVDHVLKTGMGKTTY
ncbi:hypothetical protein CBM2600_A10145 [Cupriavidus taiwanensis]|nr:hypothetical protein CBM2600_A10145 [Cupriavidus taiwanensis]